MSWRSAADRVGHIAVRLRRVTGSLPVAVYPHDPNPYQRLLYDAAQALDRNCQVEYVRLRPRLGAATLLVQAPLLRLRGFRLMHVHWQHFSVRFRGHPLYTLSLANALTTLWVLRLLGFKLIWTVHNAIPHERETLNDGMVTRLLANMSTGVIVHSQESIKELHALGADSDRVSVISHGSYVGEYQEAPRADARRALGLPMDARIVLFFGQMRPYKGVEDIFEPWELAASASHGTQDRPFLLLVGRCEDPDLRNAIERGIGADGRFDSAYITHDMVPKYFAAADVVILPFRTVTTSGSALLALSLGRPILAPRLGALRELPDSVGFFYSGPDMASALAASLSASAQELEEMQQHARSYADGLSWESIAAATLTVYREALAGTAVSSRVSLRRCPKV